uniref:Tumor necrosis factor alpha-induced protein 8-like protein n=1 Tax=Rhabditophanes sp. KR3021 TaxID=114890 RepID=A0AC35UAR6_9BILA
MLRGTPARITRKISKTFGHRSVSNCSFIPEESSKTKDATAFSSASFFLRAQKKMAGTFGSRQAMKVFSGNASNKILDDLYVCLKVHYGKTMAEKVVKYIIKISIKLFLVEQEGIIVEKDQIIITKLTKVVRNLALTFVSFVDVDYSYDRAFLTKQMDELQTYFCHLVDTYLSDKSSKRLEFVFTQLNSSKLHDAIFKIGGELDSNKKAIAANLSELLDKNEI